MSAENEKQATVMYYYFDDQGNKLWSSNEQLALSRAKAYDSEVYRISIDKKEESK
jgi:hypothetical protein